MSIGKTPGKNEVLFVWFNHYSGVALKTPSKTLVIDPVDVKPRDFKHVDAVLITHEHYDHLDQALVAEMYKLTGCTVVADPTSTRRLRNLIPPDKLKEVSAGQEITMDKVTIKAEKSNHPPAATPICYLVTSEDNLRIFHASDSLPYPEMALVGEDKLDVVFCTVGIAPGASPESGVNIARFTKAKVAVPYHTGSIADQRRFAEIMKKELPKITCLVPERSKIYQVSRRS